MKNEKKLQNLSTSGVDS